LPRKSEGAGNAGCFGHTRSLVCENKKHTSIVTTGIAGSTGIPCANGFNGFLRALPGEPGFLATITLRIIPQGLTPASGRQNHTTSPSAGQRSRQKRSQRPPHPASRS